MAGTHTLSPDSVPIPKAIQELRGRTGLEINLHNLKAVQQENFSILVQAMDFLLKALTEAWKQGLGAEFPTHACRASLTLRAPREVPHVQPQGPVFLVASPHTDCVYAAGANLENTRRQELGYQREARQRREPGRDGGNSQCNYDKP